MKINVKDFIPEPLYKYGNGIVNLVNKIQEIHDYFYNKIYGIRYLYNPERTPLVNDVNNFVGAYISKFDTVRDSKEKMSKAIYINKNLGSFHKVYKPFLDKLLTVDSQLYDGTIRYTPFTVEQSKIESPSLIDIYNPNGYSKNKGEVYIDVTRMMTQDEIDRIIALIYNMIPIYFDVYIGYQELSGLQDFTIESSLIEGIDWIETSLSPQAFVTQITI